MEKQKKFKRFSFGTPGFVAGALVLLVSLNILVLSNIFIPKEELKEGSVADKTIKSPKTVYFKSQIKTKEAQEKAKEKVEKIYRFDASTVAQQKAKAEEVFKKIDEILIGNSSDKANLISNVLDLKLSQDSANYILELKPEEYANLKAEVSASLNKIQENEKIKDDEKFSSEIIEGYLAKGLSEKGLSAIKELVSALLIHNYVFSEEETNKKTEEAKNEIGPVSLLIAKDEVILNSGKVVDKLDLEKLEAVGLKKTDFFNPKTLGMITISTILILVAIFYFRYIYTAVRPVNSYKAFFIFAVFFLISVSAFQTITPLKPIMAYIIPLAAPIILIAILVSNEAAVFSAIIFSLFLGIVSLNSLELTSIYLITSLAGIYSLKSVKGLEDFFKIGFYLAGLNFVVATAFHLIAGSFSLRTISVLLGAASIYGLGAVVLILGTLLFWGNFFKITTLLELLELENPNHLLLKTLSLKAPGTYHHSILVSNLAEKAASDIGADTLLIRVGAIYHDIGKTVNPTYFIENQKRYNIHEKLKDPEISAQIIKGHVANGLELAQKNKLPKEIFHFIESHHGTSEVFYFLTKAKEEKIKIDLSKFSYEGPLPQTKEAAILMLADVIEAKSRASQKLSAKTIKELVFDIIDSRLKGGQLNASDLSLKEIESLKKSFINTLATMYHKRIEYPNEKE